MVAANTWGISGPAFLVIYGGLFVAAALACWATRAAVLRRLPAAAPGELHPVDLALLREGRGLAVLVAWLDLRRQGVVTVVGEGELLERRHTRRDLQDLPSAAEFVVGEVPPGAHPLERAVAEEMRQPAASTVLMRSRIEWSPVLDDSERSLTSRGLLLDEDMHRRLRLAALWFLPLLALGVVRLVAGLANGKPVLFLVGFLVATVAVAYVMARPQRRRRTPAGDAVVEAARQSVADATAVLGSGNGRRGVSVGFTDPEAQAVATNPQVVAAAGFSTVWLGAPALAASFGFVPQRGRDGRSAQYASSCGGGCGGGGGGCGGGCGGGGCGG